MESVNLAALMSVGGNHGWQTHVDPEVPDMAARWISDPGCSRLVSRIVIDMVIWLLVS